MPLTERQEFLISCHVKHGEEGGAIDRMLRTKGWCFDRYGLKIDIRKPAAVHPLPEPLPPITEESRALMTEKQTDQENNYFDYI